MAAQTAHEQLNPRREQQGKILVTGGSGHLGANLVRRLLDDGHDVRVLVRHGSNNAALEGLNVERVYGDLRSLAAMEKAVLGCKHVYHCAARLSTLHGDLREKRDIFDCNVVGTRNVLEAARAEGVTRVVVSGSFSATGYHLTDPSQPADEGLPFYPFSRPLPYEASKAAVEHECLKAFAEGLDVVVATSCAILGPHDYKPSRMGKALCDFAAGKLYAYIPGGFEFVAARDIVQGHVLAMERGRAGQKYVFSTRFLTLDQIMAYFEEITGRQKPRWRLPAPIMAKLSEVSSFVLTNFFPSVPQRLTPGAVRILRMQRHADCTKAKTELGYAPSSILEAIYDAHEDFVRRGIIPRGKQTTVVAAKPVVMPTKAAPATEEAVSGNGQSKPKPQQWSQPS